MAQTTSVLWSVNQGLDENAKEQARQNIDAASVKSVEDVKTDLTNLTEVVNNHTTEIVQIKEDVKGIDSKLNNKKDKQPIKNFNGSSTKTIKNISQNAHGELTVEFEDIDLSLQGKEWKEVDIDFTKTDLSGKNEVAVIGDDGYIGYYVTSNSLRLTWYNDSSATFKMWTNDGYTEINGAGPVALGTQFYNGNGQHNTLRWKLNSFRCVDFHFNPDTKKLYWKEL